MTSAVESTPDDQDRTVALSTTDGAEAFLPGSDAPAAFRSVGSWLLDYSAHAAMIVGLVGFAWTVSNHVVSRPAAPAAQAAGGHAAANPTPKADELADLRHANQQIAEDLRHLRADLDRLGGTVRDDKTAARVHALQAGLESVQNGLSAARGETTAAVAQISSKLEKVEHEPANTLRQLSERLGKLERNAVDPAPTGSLAPRTAAAATAPLPTPPAKPAPAKVASLDVVPHRAEEAKPQDAKVQDAKVQDAKAQDRAQDAKTVDNRPPVLPNYVVRDVYEGVAIIEGRRGPMEVVPGVSIPGAGVVKSIDRHGGGWTVTTTKGLLAYAAPPRDYRRASRGAYPYGADF